MGGYDTCQKQGVFHMDDLNYLFPMSVFPNSVVTDGQRRVQQLLLDLICSFSRGGQPSYSAPDDGLTQLVPPLSLEAGVSRFFKVSPEPQIENDDKLQKELTLWKRVHMNTNYYDWEIVDKNPSIIYSEIACNSRS